MVENKCGVERVRGLSECGRRLSESRKVQKVVKRSTSHHDIYLLEGLFFVCFNSRAIKRHIKTNACFSHALSRWTRQVCDHVG